MVPPVRPKKALVVAIDGPSGSGKSSVSRGAASELGWRYLDTGAMYRAAALAAMNAKTDLTDSRAVDQLLNETVIESGTDPRGPHISVNGQRVDDEIRSAAVTGFVSAVSALPAVRTVMVERQRRLVNDALATETGIIVEGRDIGTTVLPDADLKVFLTADTRARAERRADEDVASGRSADPNTTAQALQARDEADSKRAASPLTKAPDATEVDATDLDLPGVIDVVLGLIDERLR